MKLRIYHMLAIVLAISILPGCQKAQDAIVNTALEKATGAKINRDKGAVSIQTEEGELHVKSATDTAGLTLPPEFPDDVYLPGKYKVLSTMVIGDGLSLSASTPTDVNALFTDLEQNMQNQGWKREMVLRGDTGSTIAFSKDEQRQVQFTLSNEEEDGGSFLGIFISLPNKD
jgi:hypothetical protein